MQCASEMGYDVNGMFGMSDMLGVADMLNNAFMPAPGQMWGLNTSPQIRNLFQTLPYGARQNAMRTGQNNLGTPNLGVGQSDFVPSGSVVEVDEKMSKRRELKMQMHLAVENEEFERAAEIRDMLKNLETADLEGRATCDSETD